MPSLVLCTILCIRVNNVLNRLIFLFSIKNMAWQYYCMYIVHTNLPTFGAINNCIYVHQLYEHLVI